jgi:hypothetical protein
MPPTLILIRHAQAIHNIDSKPNPFANKPTPSQPLTALFKKKRTTPSQTRPSPTSAGSKPRSSATTSNPTCR